MAVKWTFCLTFPWRGWLCFEIDRGMIRVEIFGENVAMWTLLIILWSIRTPHSTFISARSASDLPSGNSFERRFRIGLDESEPLKRQSMVCFPCRCFSG